MNQSLAAQRVQAAAQFGREIIDPDAEKWNAAGSVPREFFSLAADHKLCALLVPTEFGGDQLSMQTFSEILSTLAGHCMASTFGLVVHNNFAAALARHGSPEQRDRYLRGMLDGSRVGAFLLTEPGVGSDATAISTRASRHADSWILNGEKAWISNAVNADILSVYAQTEPHSAAAGIASFIVERETPGIALGEPYSLFGGHALGTAGFSFNDCAVNHSALMAPAGQAFRNAMRGIDIARFSVAAMCCGMLARALAEAVEYTAKRSAFGQSIGDFQGVQWMLADCATDLEAARALNVARRRAA